MVCMSRNKSRFFYALYMSKEQGTDDWGNPTGGVDITYGDPQECRANVSAAKGETQTRQFGESENYDKVIVMEGSSPPIDEYSILWIDRVPRLDENGALALNDEGEVITPHDYIVKKVARSLNSVSIAISKVNVQ